VLVATQSKTWQAVLFNVPRILHVHPTVVVIDVLLIWNVFTSVGKALLDSSVLACGLAFGAELGVSTIATAVHPLQI
jgi:hypothetical protein